MKKIVLFLLLLVGFISFAQNNYALAENYYRESEYEKASQLYKKLYDKNPFNTTYLKRLISCYQETNHFLKAENLLKTRLEKYPNLYYLNVLLGYNFERQQQKEKAVLYYEKALKNIDINPNYGGIVGSFFKENNALDYALKAYEKTMLKNPNANYRFQIARIYGEKGAFQQMFEAYVDLVDTNENWTENVKRYVSLYITDDAKNENNILFKKTVLRKSVSQPKDVWNLLLSWLFSIQKEYGKALVQEKALFQRNTSSLTNIIDLGTVSFENKDFLSAKKCFDFILETTKYQEEKLQALLFKTKIAIALKNPATEQLFQEIFKFYGKNRNTLDLQITYADYLTFQKNQPETAKVILEDAIAFAASKFEKAKIKLKLGDILIFTGQFNKALIYFSQIQTTLKNHPLAQQARFKVAQTSYFKGDFEWAKAQLKILKSSATQLIANDAVALFLTITDNEPVDSIPSGLIQYAKADVLSFQNKNKEAIAVLEKIKTNFKGMPIEDEVFFKQGQLYMKEQAYTKAAISFEKVVAMNPQGILIDDSYFQLAELYQYHLNDTKKAAEYYQKILFDYPSSIYLVSARKNYRKLRGDLVQ